MYIFNYMDYLASNMVNCCFDFPYSQSWYRYSFSFLVGDATTITIANLRKKTISQLVHLT